MTGLRSDGFGGGLCTTLALASKVTDASDTTIRVASSRSHGKIAARRGGGFRRTTRLRGRAWRPPTCTVAEPVFSLNPPSSKAAYVRHPSTVTALSSASSTMASSGVRISSAGMPSSALLGTQLPPSVMVSASFFITTTPSSTSPSACRMDD
ncbi:hypothetical protein PIB30_027523 [Stylosanthes scabra]|uniref:Uncharacterized protein n=1 Tax=Stylosanthes scabra TaxID=79078 RepID=A0ABU6SAF8_9FABA|nr:hypothetical protein [Stylosanthes scabra]